MSFGLIQRSEDLQTAMKEAINRKIAVLAATGEHANSKPMHHPTRHHEFFKIFAPTVRDCLRSRGRRHGHCVRSQHELLTKRLACTLSSPLTYILTYLKGDIFSIW